METPSQELYKQLCYGPFNPYIVMHTLYLTIFAIHTLFLFFLLSNPIHTSSYIFPVMYILPDSFTCKPFTSHMRERIVNRLYHCQPLPPLSSDFSHVMITISY